MKLFSKGKSRKLFAGVLSAVLVVLSLPMTAFAAEKEDEPSKVIVTVEGQTLGQGYYIEPELVEFDEFIEHWKDKGVKVSPDEITAGGVLAYALDRG